MTYLLKTSERLSEKRKSTLEAYLAGRVAEIQVVLGPALAQLGLSIGVDRLFDENVIHFMTTDGLWHSPVDLSFPHQKPGQTDAEWVDGSLRVHHYQVIDVGDDGMKHYNPLFTVWDHLDEIDIPELFVELEELLRNSPLIADVKEPNCILSLDLALANDDIKNIVGPGTTIHAEKRENGDENISFFDLAEHLFCLAALGSDAFVLTIDGTETARSNNPQTSIKAISSHFAFQSSQPTTRPG